MYVTRRSGQSLDAVSCLGLDENNQLRIRNQQIFLENLDSSKYRTDFRVEGSSNYAFNLILQKADLEFTDRLMQRMREEKIEFRRGSAGGGNQLRQPYLRERLGISIKTFPMWIMSIFMGSTLAISQV